MRVVALISGGKDSIFSILECISQGHDIVALANMQPPNAHKEEIEMDSFMFQSVAAEGIHLIAKAMSLPLYQSTILGSANCQSLSYNITDTDEVEDLFRLLLSIREKHPQIDGLASGAILSNYQRERLENICERLGWLSLAYLWRRDQKELLMDMICSGIFARVVKIAAFGLQIQRDLGASLTVFAPHIFKLANDTSCGLNPCGEGGEFETFTFDCPLYHQRIVTTEDPKIVIHSAEPYSTVAYLRYNGLALECKDPNDVKKSQKELVAIKNTVDIGGSEESRRPFLSNMEILTNLCRDVPVEIVKSSCDAGCSDFDQKSISIYGTGTCLGVSVLSPEGDINQCMLDAATRALLNVQRDLNNANLSMDQVIHCHVTTSAQDIPEPHMLATLNRLFDALFDSPASRISRVGHVPPCQVRLSSNWSVDLVTLVDPEICLPDGATDSNLIVVAMSMTVVLKMDETVPVEGMRIRSLSHWAPAVVGPCSQSIRVGPNAFYGGQTGLQPESLQLPPSNETGVKHDDLTPDVDQQCWLALRHVHRLIRAVERDGWRRLQFAIVYATSVAVLRRAREQFHSSVCESLNEASSSSCCCCICADQVVWTRVHSLPKGAAVQWQFATAPRPARILANKVESAPVGALLLVRPDCLPPKVPARVVVVPVYGFLDDSLQSVIVDCEMCTNCE